MIDWSLGSTCNYKCSYCPTSLHDGKSGWHKAEYIYRSAEKIISHYQTSGRKCCFQFTGWEPTFHPQFLEIIKTLKKYDCYVMIISNGSREKSWRKEVVAYIDQINITYHWEFANFEIFQETISFLWTHLNVNVNVTMGLEDFEERKKIVNALRELAKEVPIWVTAKPLLIDFWSQLYDYTEDQLAFIETSNASTYFDIEKWNNTDESWIRWENIGNMSKTRWLMVLVSPHWRQRLNAANIVAAKNNNWYGWSCYIWLESLVIEMNGDIYRWRCRVWWRLWNVQDEDILLPMKWVKCEKRSCSCLSDIQTTKIMK